MALLARGTIVALTLLGLATLPQAAQAQIALPERLYYKFDEGVGATTANFASPGVGTAAITDQTMTATGVFGSSGLQGVGVGSGNLATGWNLALGSTDWTIAFWFSPTNNATNTISYVLGDSSVTSFRAFNGGAAGATGMYLRGGGLTDVLITGLSATNNNHIAFVYNSSLSNVTGYLNGALVTTVSQGALNINGGEFLVGGRDNFNTFHSMLSQHWMDEFQLYSRALSAGEVTDAMNANFISGASASAPEPSTLALVALGIVRGIVARRRRK